MLHPIDAATHAAESRLSAFFHEHPRAALAFSGGADSAYLLHAARRFGCDVRAYCAHTAFQPAFELADAQRLARELGAQMTVVPLDILALDTVRANPADRCYHCKRAMFGQMLRAAKADGYDLMIDGTNASDDASDRPGMRALRELCVRSPLREAGLTKAQVRALSHEAGLFTWDKPAYACLATRVPAGVAIEAEALARVERAEDALRAMGFSDLRVRLYGSAARIQLPAAQLERAAAQRTQILSALDGVFDAVLLDLKARD